MPRKGQVLSEEAIKLMKISKWKRELDQYDWGRAENYLNVEISLSQRNRVLKHCTLKEFKMLVDAGQTVQSLIDNGYSKHLLQFFSNFLKGKISVDSDTFSQAYDSGKSLAEIAEIFNITREDATFLRQLYSIKAKGGTYIHRKQTETSLTSRQKELIYGSLMGDAKKMSPSSVGFGHGTNQQEYLLWKYEELKNLCLENCIKTNSYIDSRSGANLVDGRFYTKANSDIEVIISEFYKNGKKEITQSICDQLTPFSIAVWYMDDGYTNWYERLRKIGINSSETCMFCTESFSPNDCFLLRKMLDEKYGITTRLIFRKREEDKSIIGQRIVVEIESNNKFIDLIRPHILPMFLYKIDYDAYLYKINVVKF